MLQKKFALTEEEMLERFQLAVEAGKRRGQLVEHGQVHTEIMVSREEPVALVYAGPNGSGKSTFKEYMEVAGEYISSDEIMKATLCTDIEAAAKSTELRTRAIRNRADFTFEMVMTSDRNMRILREAKDNGYILRCIYVLTTDPSINSARIRNRLQIGGDISEKLMRQRYDRALAIIPQLVELCDAIQIYDNSESPCMIFQKVDGQEPKFQENKFWDKERIQKLVFSI